MRLVYVDEAGISNAAHEPFLVVAGVIVDADKKLLAVERQLEKLVERHIPENQRDQFIFHATELFNGGGPVFVRGNSDWPLQRRLAIADDLAAIPRQFGLPIAFGSINRVKMPLDLVIPRPTTSQQITEAAHATAFLVCALKVEMWMRKQASNEVCLMIIEDNQQMRSTLRYFQTRYQQEGLRRQLDWEEGKYFPFRKIKEDPLFQPKRRRSVLQLADFCAYVIKKSAMGDSRYDRFFRAMDGFILHAQPGPAAATRSS